MKSESGSAPVETVAAIVLLLIMVLGLVQVAFALYARNVVASSVHEGARAVVELNASAARAPAVARRAALSSAGGLIDDLEMAVATTVSDREVLVRVRARATIDAPGPVLVSIPIEVTASATKELWPR